MAIKESLQNANVWARRMQVELDQDELVTFLDTRFPGSILRGPLIAVMCRYYRNTISPAPVRFIAATITAEALVKIIRREFTSGENVLQIIANSVGNDEQYKLVFATEVLAIRDGVLNAIHARDTEHARPNIANAILKKCRRY